MRKIMEKTNFNHPLNYGLLVILLLPALSIATELKLVADKWPPFTSKKQGQRIAVDLVEQALKRAEIKSQVNIVEWKTVLKGVKSGEYDAIVGAWKNFEREKFLLFSRPYLQNRVLLVGRTDNKLSAIEISQLENKRIGIVDGYAYGESILDNSKIIKVKGATVAENIRQLLDNKVDFILMDSIVAQNLKQVLPEEIKNKLVVYPNVVVAQNLHFAVRRDYPGAAALLDKFNNAIRDMIADGSYNRILGFDWLVADTDNDGVDEYIIGDQLRSKAEDPAGSENSYALFSEKQGDDIKPVRKYRVLNLEYNSWGEAQQAINKAQETGTLQYENKTSDAINLFSGKF